MSNSKSALVCLLPGLGDALVASPVLGGLRDAHFDLDVLTMLGPVERYARALSFTREVFCIPLMDMRLQGVAKVLSLRQKEYDLLVLPFPAARWQYAAIAASIGAKATWLHQYGGLASAIATARRMHQVKLRGGHRIWENRRLAVAMGLSVDSCSYEMPNTWRSDGFIRGLLGVHSGSMRYKGNEQRRWPLAHYATTLARQLAMGRSVRVFIGPNEEDDKAYFAQHCPGLEFVEQPLEVAAKKISECEVFLSNDSGLAHVAAGLGVQVLTIFGMTDPVRAQPVGCSEALRPSSCPPCFDEGLGYFRCIRRIDFRCIRHDVTVDFISRKIDEAFASRIAPMTPPESSPFRLYGVNRR